ncbi:hypothetical protein ACRALDRAFT_1081896 [Sodiomyces alcalophilus JCM 7366]|uniref:uncharacterized protein n=1 Tax=Sodiomyces alcalophilus JCM 7366 TaxID=591952 RepID=UPI0039B5D605
MSNQGTGSRWGSFLSQAVAGMEAHLDSMLAEGDGSESVSKPTESSSNESITHATPQSTFGKQASSKPSPTNSRTHDRLQKRLAKVVSQNIHSLAESDGAGDSSRVGTIGAAPIDSLESSLSPNSSEKVTRQSQISLVQNALSKEACSPLSTPGHSQTATLQRTNDNDRGSPSLPTRARFLDDANNGSGSLVLGSPEYRHDQSILAASNCQTCDAYEAQFLDIQAEQQKETRRLVEQIDALQAKLQYLTRDASISAKKFAAESAPGTAERKLAEKDEKIYLLMEEGRTMAVTEQRHRTVIKKLKTELSAIEKTAAKQEENYEKAQAQVEALQARVVRLDHLEQAYIESQQQLSNVRSELESLQSELTFTGATTADLRRQMEAAMDQTDAASSKSTVETLRAQQQLNKELKDAIASLQTENSLAAEKANKQVADFAHKARVASERARVVEVELRSELQAMEGRLEAMRALAEEASTGVVGDTHAKLLRQIETLQTQHAIALENWQGIEASLIGRLRSLETERDDALQRESEMRKKAREMAFRSKCLEEEIQSVKDKIPTREQHEEMEALRARLGILQNRAEAAEKELANARAEAVKQRTVYTADRGDHFDRRLWLEEEPAATSKVQSRPESPLLSIRTRTHSSDRLLLQGAPARTRNISTPGSMVDDAYDSLQSTRRLSSQALVRPPMLPTSPGPSSLFMASLEASRESQQSLALHEGHQDGVFQATDTFSSPRLITQDMVSMSTAGAGPSVQLVERMSAAIRRLEGEKVASREELARISSQRDEARTELAVMMKEMETGNAARKKVSELEAKLEEINSRYQTTLELLGEKSELVEELRADVEDVKAMYRELVERTVT